MQSSTVTSPEVTLELFEPESELYMLNGNFKVLRFLLSVTFILFVLAGLAPQWGAADAEIKVPSGENTELKRSPFKVWSRSVY